MTTDQQITAEYQRHPLDLARRLTGMHTTGDRRAYLAETGSQYAGSDDIAIIDAAFHGHVLNALASLADAYGRELTAHAATQAKLDSTQHTLAVTASALAEAQEAAEGY